MSEWVDLEKCNGCGICVSLCPRDVIRLNENIRKAIVKYPEDCVNCQFCQAYCPRGAIEVKPISRPILVSWK